MQINQEIKNIYVYDLIGNKINIFSQIGQNIYNFDFPNYGFYNIILEYNELGSAKTKSIQVIYNRWFWRSGIKNEIKERNKINGTRFLLYNRFT